MAVRQDELQSPLELGTSEGSTSHSSEESFSSSSDEDEDEPVLKYKRFAKEVVQSTCGGSEGTRDVINCITVHPKVTSRGSTIIFATLRQRG